MLLTEQNLPDYLPDHRNPYKLEGARNIARENKRKFQDMIIDADNQQAIHADGWAFLAKSPLARDLRIAAAMITLDLLEQGVSENGSCKLRLTDLARKHLEKAHA